MKYLVLAYGDERDWKALSQSERDTLLAQDDLLRRRGSLVAAVENAVTTVRSWDGTPTTTGEPFPKLLAPLAGFGIIEATDLSEAIALVAKTPCARAKGAVEIRAILHMNSDATVVG